MSPPIELFLTTIVSSPALRQRQGSTVHDLSAPTADYAYHLDFCAPVLASAVSQNIRISHRLAPVMMEQSIS